jgi:hypothetical protein
MNISCKKSMHGVADRTTNLAEQCFTRFTNLKTLFRRCKSCFVIKKHKGSIFI